MARAHPPGSKGDLFVRNFSGLIVRITSKPIKTSGAVVPKVSVSGPAPDNFQIIFGTGFIA
ncbi:MAG: hypothetical protein WA447_21560 [Candidatus Binatus sp.]